MGKKRPKHSSPSPTTDPTPPTIANDSSLINKNSGRKTYAEALAQRLEFLAERLGSKYKMDQLLGLGRGTYAAYCRRPFKVPGADFLNRIAEATGCDPGWLISGYGEPFPADRLAHLIELRDTMKAALDNLTETIDQLERLRGKVPPS